RGNLGGRERIDEARGKSSQATVAQAGFFFLREQFIEIQVQLADRLSNLLVDAEIDQVVAEVRPHQKFGGKVCDRARTLRRVRRGGTDPALQQAIAHRVRQRLVVIVLRRQRR